jgi:hypothetical protein
MTKKSFFAFLLMGFGLILTTQMSSTSHLWKIYHNWENDNTGTQEPENSTSTSTSTSTSSFSWTEIVQPVATTATVGAFIQMGALSGAELGAVGGPVGAIIGGATGMLASTL